MIARLTLCLLLAAAAPALAGEQPGWDCHHTSIVKTFGGSQWQVYACDTHHMAFVAAHGSAADPYAFQIDFTDDGVVITSTGDGDKKAADAAYNDIANLSEADFHALLLSAMAGR